MALVQPRISARLEAADRANFGWIGASLHRCNSCMPRRDRADRTVLLLKRSSADWTRVCHTARTAMRTHRTMGALVGGVGALACTMLACTMGTISGGLDDTSGGPAKATSSQNPFGTNALVAAAPET